MFPPQKKGLPAPPWVCGNHFSDYTFKCPILGFFTLAQKKVLGEFSRRFKIASSGFALATCSRLRAFPPIIS